MTRVVVVGSGLAGLTAALHAAESGCRVTVVTKTSIAESNTRYAQGGIAAVVSDDDRARDHAADTLRASAGLADAAAVDVLVGDARERVDELIASGVGFDREPDGSLAGGLEAAHSHARVLHAGGDATGRAIHDALVARTRRSAIEVVEGAPLAELMVRDGRVVGAVVLVDGAPTVLEADAVVLATGGAGRLYARTTNPAVATGDGIAAALRAGAAVADLEFVQFHPTVLAAGEPFLLSEAVRGEGAVLRDAAGRRFAFDAHPDGELAPRDVVARAIAATMARQGGAPVVLDATMLGADFLARRFPTIDRTLRARGWDWARTPVPVTPAAHYLMGGVVTDTDGRTRLPGLYAVGEVARTGVHGANRLASNSLLEAAVFGARAGDAVRRDAVTGAWAAAPAASAPLLVNAGAAGSGSTHRAEAGAFDRAALQALMWRDAGLIRTAAGLDRAAAVIAAWREEQSEPPRTTADLEDANLLLVAASLVDAARRRPASVGAHHRADDSPSPAARADEGTAAPVLEGAVS